MSHPPSQGLVTSNFSNGSMNLVRMKIGTSQTFEHHETKDGHEVHTTEQSLYSMSPNRNLTGQTRFEQPENTQPLLGKEYEESDKDAERLDSKVRVFSMETPRILRKRDHKLHSTYQGGQTATQ